MIKPWVVIFLICLVVNSNSFAQEKEDLDETNIITQVQLSEVTSKSVADSFIFRNDFSASHFHRLQNGTNLDYKATRKIVAIAPDNKEILESEKRWRVFSYVLTGLSIAQFGYGIASICGADLPYNSVNIAVFFVYTLPFTMIVGQTANTKLQQSVDNYNYYRSYNNQ